MTTRTAWFCPSCQKHHAPHVDTCPNVSEFDSIRPGNPFVVVVPSVFEPRMPYVSPTVAPREWKTTTSAVNWDPNVPYSLTN